MPALRKDLPKIADYVGHLRGCWHEHLATKPRRAPTVISTFAGCGGSSLGYSMAGFREVLAVEWDDDAVATFKLNFPDVPVWHGDIAKLTGKEAMRLSGVKAGELDVFDGSPPCQGFSTSGRRVMDDPRNHLFREYVRLIGELKPKVFVMENVSGMVKGKMKILFAEILRTLKAEGYAVSARLMNTQWFGVPQARERIIFVGVRNDLKTQPSHPEPQCQPIAAATALAGVRVDKAHIKWLYECADKYAAYRHWDQIPAGKRLCDVAGHKEGFSARKQHALKPFFTVCKNDGVVHMHGKMHWSERRRFSIDEFKRAGSFPDEFDLTRDFAVAVARIGNSVPPLFMRALAKHIRSVILEAKR